MITNLKQIYTVNPVIAISFPTLILITHFTTKNELFTARDCISKDIVHLPLTFWKHLESLEIWFCKRVYLQKVIDAQLEGVSEKAWISYLKNLTKKVQVYLLLWHSTLVFTTLVSPWENISYFFMWKRNSKVFNLLHLSHFILVTV